MNDELPYNLLAPAAPAGAEARWFAAHRTPGWAIRQLIELAGLGVALGRRELLADAATFADVVAGHIASAGLNRSSVLSCRHHFAKLETIVAASGDVRLSAAAQRLEEAIRLACPAGPRAYDIEVWLREAFGMTVDVPLGHAFASMWRAISALTDALPEVPHPSAWSVLPDDEDVHAWLEHAIAAHRATFAIQRAASLRVVRAAAIPRSMWRRWFALTTTSDPTLVLAPSGDGTVDGLDPLHFFTWRLVHDAAHLAHLALLVDTPVAWSLGLPPFVATAEGFALTAEWQVLEQLLSSADSPWHVLLAALGVPVAAAVRELAGGLRERVMRLALDCEVNGRAVSAETFIASFTRLGSPEAVVRPVTCEWTGLPGMGAIYPLSMAALLAAHDAARQHQLLRFEAPLVVGEREIELWIRTMAGAHGYSEPLFR